MSHQLFSFFVVRRRHIREQPEGREKKIKKNHLQINSNRAYMHGYCSFAIYILQIFRTTNVVALRSHPYNCSTHTYTYHVGPSPSTTLASTLSLFLSRNFELAITQSHKSQHYHS